MEEIDGKYFIDGNWYAEGDRVRVSDVSVENARSIGDIRIFIAPRKAGGVWCVSAYYEAEYPDNGVFGIAGWKYITPLEEPKVTIELTKEQLKKIRSTGLI